MSMLDSGGKAVTLAEAPVAPRSVVKGSSKNFMNPFIGAGADKANVWADDEQEAQDQVVELMNRRGRRDADGNRGSSSSSSATSYGVFGLGQGNGKSNPVTEDLLKIKPVMEEDQVVMEELELEDAPALAKGAVGRSSDNAGGFGFLSAVADVVSGSAKSSKKHGSRLSSKDDAKSKEVDSDAEVDEGAEDVGV